MQILQDFTDKSLCDKVDSCREEFTDRKERCVTETDKITWCCVGFRITSVQKNGKVAQNPRHSKGRKTRQR